MNVPIVELAECGCCGGFHHADFGGDCRDGSERFPVPFLPYDGFAPSLEQAVALARHVPGQRFEADGRVVWSSNPSGRVISARRNDRGKLFDVKVEG